MPGLSHTVHLVATEVVRVAGALGYHTSVHVNGREFYFDVAGVVAGPALRSHTGGRAPGPKTEVIDFGQSEFDGEMLVRTLGPLFSKGTYDVLRKNCNSFTDAALFLLTGERLPAHYSRGERILLATEPISMRIVPHLMAARSLLMGNNANAAEAVSMYDCNPSAVGFSVDRVISSCLCELRQSRALSGRRSSVNQQDPFDAQRSRSAQKRRERSSCALCP